MAIKHSPEALMVYLAMSLWLISAVARLMGRWACNGAPATRKVLRGLGEALFAAGCLVVAIAFTMRWRSIGRPPLQTMYEVLMALGVAMYPVWLFCRHVLGARGTAGASVIGIAVLVPVGFVLRDGSEPLNPLLQSPLFVPHVALYLLGYVVLILAAMQVAGCLTMGVGVAMYRPDARAGNLRSKSQELEALGHRLVLLGFPLLIAGLLLGAVWGKMAWGDYWNWDPKELWSLATALVYIAYLHFRAVFGTRYHWLNAALVVIGAIALLVTLWVSMSSVFKSVHAYAA